MTEWIISSSVLISAMMLLRGVLRGRISPRIQYALWGLVLLRLLMPFSLFQSGLSIQNLQEEAKEHPQVQQVYQTFTAPIIPGSGGATTDRPSVPDQPVPNQQPQLNQQPITNPLPQQSTQGVPSTPSEHRSVSLGDVLVCIWISGMILIGVWMTGCNLRFSARLRRSRKPLDIPDSLLPVYRTGAVETPCLFGLFQPAVYLTPEAAENEQLRSYVLTHELTHYRQFDHVWAVLRTVALVLHWYNPLVWMAFRASRQDGEMACDEGTLRELGEEHRGNYGRTLIGLATGTRFRGTLVTATSMGGTKRAMKERIVILMKNPKTALMTMVSLILVCALIVGCTFTGAVDKPTEPEETVPVETTPDIDATSNPEKLVPVLTDALKLKYEAILNEKEQGEKNWAHQAMGIIFDNPSQINLAYLFGNGLYNGSYYIYDAWNECPEEDIPELINQGLNPNEPIISLYYWTMERILLNTFQTDVDTLLSTLPDVCGYSDFLESYFIHEAGFPGVEEYTITGVIEQGNMRYLYYTQDSGYAVAPDGSQISNTEMVLTLHFSADYGYQVLGNQIAKDHTFIPESVVKPTPDPLTIEDHPYYELFRSTGFEYNEGKLGCYTGTNKVFYNEVDFLYTGDSSTVPLAALNMTLTLPEDWLDRVIIYQQCDDTADPGIYNGYCYVFNRGIAAAHLGLDGTNLEDFLGKFRGSDFIFALSAISKNTYFNDDPLNPAHRIFLGENATHYYYLATPDTQDPNCSELLLMRNYLIDQIGEDAYWALVDDLIVDENSIQDMITIHPAPESYTELTAYEIDQVNKAFASTWSYQVDHPNGELTCVESTPISCFFTSYYADPTQIDLVEFLRYFSAHGIVDDWASEEVTEEEFDDIRVLDGFLFDEKTDLDQLPVPIHKYPSSTVNEVIFRYTGYGLNDLEGSCGKGDAFYSEEYDAYYNFTSDFGPGFFICIGGMNYGSHIELYSENSILTLVRDFGDWKIYSHLPKV